jgi:hypothetical protein
MKKAIAILSVLALIIYSCSSGKKALQKGDYFSAQSKAVERLKSSPDNKNATKVLREGYPLTLEWTQEELDQVLSLNDPFKWERAINLMEQTNRLSDQIRSTPAARRIISDPKNYTSELNMAYEKAADARYNAGLTELDTNTRESARRAYDHFNTANHFIADYKNVRELMETAKEKATLKVILDAIPVPSQRYQLSSEFFYDQVFEYLNNQFSAKSFVNFYSPFQAEKEGLNNPDFVVDLEFFDFSIGNLTRSEKEETLENRIQIESRDTTKIQYKTYVAKLKTFTDQVVSGGTLRVQIIETSTDKLFSDELIPGSFTWINQYAMFVGDAEALNNNQLELTRRKVLPLPPQQDLFIEFTRPIYDQLIQKLNRFFRQYN